MEVARPSSLPLDLPARAGGDPLPAVGGDAERGPAAVVNSWLPKLTAELRTLRKGQGIYVPEIRGRVGPALRQLCGVTADDSSGEIRQKVAVRVEELASSLPEDLRMAVLAALAIDPRVRRPLFEDRLRWIAEHLNRDARTARRRLDDGIAQLAEMAAAVLAMPTEPTPLPPGPAPSLAWRVAELQSIVLLDQPAREAIELRRIVAEQDGIEVLDLAFTLPRDLTNPDVPSKLLIDVLFGGTIFQQSVRPRERFGFGLRLPRPLDRGESYEYGVRFRIPPGQAVRPHYICFSKHPVDRFDLRLRFSAHHPPAKVWKLPGVLHREVDDLAPTHEPVTLDAAGDLYLSFQRLTPGLAYGARWQSV